MFGENLLTAAAARAWISNSLPPKSGYKLWQFDVEDLGKLDHLTPRRTVRSMRNSAAPFPLVHCDGRNTQALR
jgi:hypothetical protein